MENTKGQKRLSLISDVILFLAIVFVALVVIKTLNVPQEEEIEQVSSLVEPTSDTINSENSSFISKIKNEYGITVLYGNDIKDYAAKVNAIEQTNANIINHNLKIIYKALQKYPQDMFNKMKSKKAPMYIMLVSSFNNNNIALASRTSLNVFRLYISNNENFERSFHHEMYHIMEYLMEANEKYIFASWYRLNPKGFQYITDIAALNTDFVYNQSIYQYNHDNVYFLTKYSKTSAKEDRAEIFAELMMLTAEESYLQNDSPIRKKVDSMMNTIDQYLTKSSFPFFKFLK